MMLQGSVCFPNLLSASHSLVRGQIGWHGVHGPIQPSWVQGDVQQKSKCLFLCPKFQPSHSFSLAHVGSGAHPCLFIVQDGYHVLILEKITVAEGTCLLTHWNEGGTLSHTELEEVLRGAFGEVLKRDKWRQVAKK